jgi:aryl-alcohol dehydrogenase-like predicted oxidoreductase
VLSATRELGIGFVPYSPLGHGFLTGQIRSMDDPTDDDWRKTSLTAEQIDELINLTPPAEIATTKNRCGSSSAGGLTVTMAVS